MIGHRTHNTALVAAILNHPDIRPTIERVHVGPIDAAPLVGRHDVVCFAGEPGIYLFAHRGADEWQAHVGIFRRARGVQSLKMGIEAFAYLFGELGARRCHARAPLDLPQVAVFAKRLGFKRALLDPDSGFELLVKESA